MAFPIHTIIILVLILGSFVLQFFLSKCEGKWPGRILPIISFLLSFIYPLNFVALEGISPELIIQLLLIMVLANIPTYIYLAIYFVCREKIRRRQQMDRMNIQDLN